MTEHVTTPSELNETLAISAAVKSPYLTATEAGEYLRTTVQGIYSLVKRGKLHPMPGRPGRLLFTRVALDRYLNTRR